MTKKLLFFTITIVLLLCPKVNASTTSESEVKARIVKHSIEMGVEPALALSLAKSESKFRHDLRSPYGAVGVFQLMPDTARRLGVNPYYLSDNIKGGLMYYKMMYKMFGSTELALAAYNAGPTAVLKYKTVPPIGETRQFVNTIMTEYRYQKKNPDPAIKNAMRKQPPKFEMMIKPIAGKKPDVKPYSKNYLKPVAVIKPIANITENTNTGSDKSFI